MRRHALSVPVRPPRDVSGPALALPMLATSFFTHPDAVGFSANDLGEAALSFVSGMAAVSALFLDRVGSGEHLVLSNVC